MMIGAAAMLPLGVLAAASTPPSTLVDLTTNGSNPSGSVNDYSSTYNTGKYNGTKAFDGVGNTADDSRWLAAKAASMWVIYTFKVATVVDAIRIYLPNYGTDAARAPKDWKFQGSNDKSTWDDLDTQTGETNWTKGGARYYKFTNTTAYKYYKFNCTANNGDGNCMQVLEIEFYCVGGANSTWTGGGTTDLLSDVENWGGTSMPGSEYGAYIDDTGSIPAVVPGGLTVYKNLRVGNDSGKNAKVVQTNGTVRILSGGVVIGRAGSVGEYSISGGEFVSTSATTYIGARSGKDTGVLDISGTADVKFKDVRLCSPEPSAGTTAKINVSENGAFSFTEMNMGHDSANTTSIVYQTGGTVSGSTYLRIGYASKAVGVYEMTGGTCAIADQVTVGRFGTGTLAVSGAGTVLTAKTVRVGLTESGNKGTGTLAVTNGGEIAATQIYAGAGASATNQATVTFNGGKLTATAANDAFLKDFSNIQLEAGGLTIDTQGYALGISNCTFNVTGNGKITVVGGGTVTFTNVTVHMAEKPSGTYVFAETDGTFSGLPNLGGVNGCTILLSDDFKRVTVSPRGFIIAVF